MRLITSALSHAATRALMVATFVAWPMAAHAAALPDSITRVLTTHGISPERAAIWVEPASSGAPLLVHNPDAALNPASVMKLLTTFAALEVLGPAYQWKTEVHIDTPVRDGVLSGDLWLRGRGDPWLVAEQLWKMIGALRRTGLQHIEGDLVFDASFFDTPHEDAGAFDGQPHRVYNQSPHALLANFNAITVEIEYDRQHDRVRVNIDPPLLGLDVDNRLRPGDGACGGYRRGVNYTVINQPGPARIVLEGRYPRACADTYRLPRTALAPEDYLHALFAALWQQWGGTLDGHWRSATWTGSADSPPLLTHESPPYGDLIRMANKFSNNVMTRHFKLTLGAERFGPPATADKGYRAMREVLERHGTDTAGLHIDNAAGLSRTNRLSARQVAAVLRSARAHPHMPEFVSSLALAGLDGTARRRFEDPPEQGRMHLKTGYLEGVSAIAGYIKTEGGQDLLVVVLADGRGVNWNTGIDLQDAVLRWGFRQ